MAEYIEREELMKFPIRLDHYNKEHGDINFVYGIETVLEYTESLPNADVAPVVHGQWIIGANNDDFDVKCSNVDGLMSLKSPESPLWKESLKPCIIALTAVLR